MGTILNFREEAAARVASRMRYTCLPLIVGDYPTMSLNIPFEKIEVFEHWFHSEGFRVDVTACGFDFSGDHYEVQLRGCKKDLMLIKLTWES